ncbi:MAG: hypothetical protein JW769_05285 [Parachlamydiales bacterium]|nr:hypothetical protein [Parachlamydiales bacterium]
MSNPVDPSSQRIFVPFQPSVEGEGFPPVGDLDLEERIGDFFSTQAWAKEEPERSLPKEEQNLNPFENHDFEQRNLPLESSEKTRKTKRIGEKFLRGIEKARRLNSQQTNNGVRLWHSFCLTINSRGKVITQMRRRVVDSSEWPNSEQTTNIDPSILHAPEEPLDRAHAESFSSEGSDSEGIITNSPPEGPKEGSPIIILSPPDEFKPIDFSMFYVPEEPLSMTNIFGIPKRSLPSLSDLFSGN